MNILLISRCPPYPLHLGDRLIVYHLARQLARRGHTIDLIAFSDRFEDIPDRVHYADLFRRSTVVADPPRISLDYAYRLIVRGARFPRQEKQAWSSTMWETIRQHIEAEQYDVAHLFGGVQVYEYAHAVEPLPAIITPYESYSLYLRRMVEKQAEISAKKHISPLQRRINEAKLRLQWRITRNFESWMFTPYRRVIVVAERDREELRALNPALPLEVIPNGVDMEYFQAGKAEREPFTLIFSGNYEYAPNVDAALRLAKGIFMDVRVNIPQAKLWIVGNAPPPELVHLGRSMDGENTVPNSSRSNGSNPAQNGNRSHANGVSKNPITVTGHVEDMRDYLNRATVFVCPLRLGAGIKNKVLEALALGIPVVATAMSVEGIDARDGEEVLLAETDAEITAAVVRLLNDAALRERLGANGRKLVEARYSWEQVAERYETIYAEVAR